MARREEADGREVVHRKSLQVHSALATYAHRQRARERGNLFGLVRKRMNLCETFSENNAESRSFLFSFSASDLKTIPRCGVPKVKTDMTKPLSQEEWRQRYIERRRRDNEKRKKKRRLAREARERARRRIERDETFRPTPAQLRRGNHHVEVPVLRTRQEAPQEEEPTLAWRADSVDLFNMAHPYAALASENEGEALSRCRILVHIYAEFTRQ